jgi:hypothetical protein
MIGCYVYANEAYDYQSMTCSARDATGRTAVCHSENPHLIAVAGRMNGDSYISFAFNMPAAVCLTVRVDNYSYDVPKL